METKFKTKANNPVLKKNIFEPYKSEVEFFLLGYFFVVVVVVIAFFLFAFSFR